MDFPYHHIPKLPLNCNSLSNHNSNFNFNGTVAKQLNNDRISTNSNNYWFDNHNDSFIKQKNKVATNMRTSSNKIPILSYVNKNISSAQRSQISYSNNYQNFNFEFPSKCLKKDEKYSHLTRLISIKKKRENYNVNNLTKVTIRRNDDSIDLSNINKLYISNQNICNESLFEELNDNENISLPYEFISFQGKNCLQNPNPEMKKDLDLE